MSASGVQSEFFGDGRENDNDLLPISTPTGPNISLALLALLLDTLCNSQLQNQELRTRCTALRKINADLQARLQVKDHGGRGRKAKKPQIIRVALFDGGAIQTAPDAFRYTGGLLGMMWGVDRVNASLIAWSAMILRFLLSADQVLQETGAVTKFPTVQISSSLPSAGPDSDAENFDELDEMDEMTDLMDRLSAPGAGDLNLPNAPLVTAISLLTSISEVLIVSVIEAKSPTNSESHAVPPSPTPAPAPHGRRGHPRLSPQVTTEVNSHVEPTTVPLIHNTRHTTRK
ncbi:hypothetical protein K435DRAFT_806732 [Dendrothele bispora CBS 962.96]|uniref:Uncharacterized protein n=1 Tax=Dendrothele bispora (strain CBS 962.96) TaxID=1314807 RepID=A0A4S8L6U8_DENBC|nr:hypothetical protein K435DRAFT_806732 [Dendrothele bispora CBS 962.96]